ncbi:MAG: hypothetical protein GY771_01430 [bacterium]|nr:hypothetical protein [bacterium]
MKTKKTAIALIPLLVIIQISLIAFFFITYVMGCETEEKERPYMLSEYEENVNSVNPPRAALGWYPQERLVSIPDNAYSTNNGFRLGVVITPRIKTYDGPGELCDKELFQGEPFWITEEAAKGKNTYFGYTDFDGKSGWLLAGTREFIAETFSPMRLVIRGLGTKYHDTKGGDAGGARRNQIKRYIGVADKGDGAAFALDYRGQTVFLDISDANFLAEDVFHTLYLRPDSMYNKAAGILDEAVYDDTAARADWFVATYPDSDKSPEVLWNMAVLMGEVEQPGKREEYLKLLQSKYPDSAVMVNERTGEVKTGAELASELPEPVLSPKDLDVIIATEMGEPGTIGEDIKTDDAGLYATYLLADTLPFDSALPHIRKVIASGYGKYVTEAGGETYEIAALGWGKLYDFYLRKYEVDVIGFNNECSKIVALADDSESKKSVREVAATVTFNFPDLKWPQLKSMDDGELARVSAARYARHGKLPRDPELAEYFTGQPWFKEDPRFDSSSLTLEDWIVINGAKLALEERE